MTTVKFTTKTLLLKAVNDVRDNNVRDILDTDYDLPPMRDDLVQNGQQEEIWTLKNGDGYDVIKGYRRTGAMRLAAAEGLTVNDAITGKPLVAPGKEPEIKVRIYEGLTPAQIAELMVDHGQRKGLNRAGLQRAMEKLFPHKTQEQVAVTLWNPIIEFYPPKKAVIEEALAKLPPGATDADKTKAINKAKGNNCRGTIQKAYQIWKAPLLLHDACMEKYRGRQAWPIDADITTLCEIHEKEIAANPALSRAKPGPLFMEKWNALLANVEKAKAAGERPKAIGMRSRQQTEDMRGQCESLCGKGFHGCQLGELAAENFLIFDKQMAELEQHLTEEQRNKLIAILMTGKATKAKAKTEEPTEEPKAE